MKILAALLAPAVLSGCASSITYVAPDGSQIRARFEKDTKAKVLDASWNAETKEFTFHAEDYNSTASPVIKASGGIVGAGVEGAVKGAATLAK